MRIERRFDCELPRQSCRLGRACVDFLTKVLLWFCLELPRKESATGGRICDARVEEGGSEVPQRFCKLLRNFRHLHVPSRPFPPMRAI
jgi:hypothetical protein